MILAGEWVDMVTVEPNFPPQFETLRANVIASAIVPSEPQHSFGAWKAPLLLR